QVLERKRPARRSPPGGRAADAERRRFFDDRVPLAARFALALPALGDGPAILADIRRTKLGHGVGLAGLPEPVERLCVPVPVQFSARRAGWRGFKRRAGIKSASGA